MEKLFLILLLLSSCSLLVSSANVSAIFIFGDSIFDAGNNHFNKNCSAQADFPPYGSSFFHRPTGRFTNGRTVADFICELYVLIFLLLLLLLLPHRQFSVNNNDNYNN
jgi:hypothetical protein